MTGSILPILYFSLWNYTILAVLFWSYPFNYLCPLFISNRTTNAVKLPCQRGAVKPHRLLAGVLTAYFILGGNTMTFAEMITGKIPEYYKGMGEDGYSAEAILFSLHRQMWKEY